MVEVEGGVQLVGAQVGGEPLGRAHPHLAHEHLRGVVLVGHRTPAAEHVVNLGLVVLRAGRGRATGHHGIRGRVGVAGLLAQSVRHVDAEAVDAAVEPEPQDVVELLANLVARPVEVRLGGVEQVQVPPAAGGAVSMVQLRPRRPAEVARPVVGRARAVAVAAHEVVARPRALGPAGSRGRWMRGRAFGQRGSEPHVLAGRVVGDDVDDHAQAEGMRLHHQRLRLLHGAEHRVDVAVVGHVVPGIVHGRGVEGRDPQRVGAQLGDVPQVRADSGDVTDAVAIRVGEGARVHLVDDGVAPPRGAHRPAPGSLRSATAARSIGSPTSTFSIETAAMVK